MKRLMLALVVLATCALVGVAFAGDYHTGLSLTCSECHVAHYSQSHGYTAGGMFTTLGPDGPYNDLLRNEPNDLCLTCHDNNSWAPDVFGANGGTARVREAGGLNAVASHRTNDAGYDEIDGHTLWSTAMPPGAGTTTYTPGTEGLECVNCHAQHGSATQYRNLLNRGVQTGKNVTYVVGTNDLTKDVFERSAASYAIGDMDFNEPDPTKSAYGAWCSSCHVDFHGSGGATNMGGASGGMVNGSIAWKRHPTADVNIGATAATYISSLSQFNSHTNRVKVMDSQGLWDGTTADNTVTPSCFSCHKAHGNMNGFGLIFMKGTGTVTEEGDGGIYKDLCRQCHVQGA